MADLNRNKKITLLLGLILIFLVEFLDYITGPEIAFVIFYVLVVVYFTWFFGDLAGFLCSGVAGVISVSTDFATGHPYYQKPGTLFWALFVRVSLLFIVAFLAARVRHELQKQRQANEELREANLQIEKLSKMKSEFTAMVSHELRTPLVAIRESIAVVYDGLAGPVNAEQKDFLERSKHNIERLGRLIDDVLDYFKLETGRMDFQMAPANLNDLIEEAVNFYRPSAQKKGIRIECRPDPSLAPFLMSADGILEVLNNILNNAVKFTRKGNIAVVSKKVDNWAEVRIKDTGLGISHEHIIRLFEPFERIEETQEGGTGLGLAISRQIIEKHGGKIWAESREGEGTTFIFSMPIVSRQTAV